MRHLKQVTNVERKYHVRDGVDAMRDMEKDDNSDFPPRNDGGDDGILLIVITLFGRLQATLCVNSEESILPALRRELASCDDSLIKKHLDRGNINIYSGRKLKFESSTEERINEIRLLD